DTVSIKYYHFLQRRCYAAARRSQDLTVPLAGHKTVAPFPPQNVQVSKLPNGLVVASLENYSPLSRVGVFVKAGSRYETAENQGVSHVLRLAANLTTKGASAFKICRGVEALGGSLTVTSTRETMVYTVDCLREHLDSLTEYLGDVSTAQEFRPWEVSELVSRVKIDKAVAQQCPQTGVFEKLHEAAYKNALSNSLYCPDHMVGHISANQVRGSSKARRFHTNDDLVHALIASEGAANGSAQANAFSVLQRILGSGPRVKRGSNITSKLCQGVAKATADPFDATAFSLSYSDSGLFGIYTVTQAGSAREVINAAVAQVRGVAEGNVSEADVTAAKNQVKTEYLMLMENSEVMLEEVGAQALAAAAYQQPDAVLQAVDAVTLDNVVKAAKTFVDGKKTMAALGHHTNTPFVDEI
uniref:Ubiquinol-cytochrome c reductase core protein 2a n=1 Tax=Takifugu rubripes TaxID=31033 RepID=A0A674MHL3_TAKRU